MTLYRILLDVDEENENATCNLIATETRSWVCAKCQAWNHWLNQKCIGCDK